VAETRKLDLEGQLTGTAMARARVMEGTKNASFVTDKVFFVFGVD